MLNAVNYFVNFFCALSCASVRLGASPCAKTTTPISFPRPARKNPCYYPRKRAGHLHHIAELGPGMRQMRNGSQAARAAKPMTDHETVARFIFLRSQGWSFNRSETNSRIPSEEFVFARHNWEV